MADTIDMDRVSGLIAEAAETLIMPRYKQLKAGDINTKSGPNDLVTIADRESERFLTAELEKLYPGTIVVGEESVSEGTKSLDVLSEPGKTVWVIDPVDGTHNFVHGEREFGVMIGLVRDDDILMGWIYDCIDKKMMTVEKGAGAWFDGVRLKTAAAKPVNALTGFAGLKYFPDRVRPYLKDKAKSFGKVLSLGCAAHEYLRLAGGQADFGLYSRVKPWDHLPGALAVRESGGSVTLWNGQPYVPSFQGHGVLVASCDEVAAEVRGTLVDGLVSQLKVKS